MTLRRTPWFIIGGVAILAVVGFAVTRALMRPATEAPTAGAEPPSGDAPLAHIRATLFYAAPEGGHLTTLVREIPLAEKLDEQGWQIVNVALHPPPAPLLAAVPAGTVVSGFFIAEGGDAFVDLSGTELTAQGGSTAEALAVYAIVNSVTANLPSVKRVQILIDGKDVDTLAGHLDLRRPLPANLALVQ